MPPEAVGGLKGGLPTGRESCKGDVSADNVLMQSVGQGGVEVNRRREMMEEILNVLDKCIDKVISLE